jgi:hypothetical protein
MNDDASPSMGVNDHCSTKYSFYLFVHSFESPSSIITDQREFELETVNKNTYCKKKGILSFGAIYGIFGGKWIFFVKRSLFFGKHISIFFERSKSVYSLSKIIIWELVRTSDAS